MFSQGLTYYPPSHYFKKFIWALVYWTLFRYSPRLFYSWRNILLRVMGAKIGRSVRIFPDVSITYPWNLEIGDYSIIAWKVQVYNLGKITLGKKTIISQYVHLCAGDHDYQSVQFTLLMPPITIGDEVWIATEAFIGPGVIISNRVVIGARAVVVKNIPEGAVAGGNPAKILKMRDL